MNAQSLPVSISTAFASYKVTETAIAESIAKVSKGLADALEITAGNLVGNGAAFAGAVVAEGKTAEGISGLLNACGLYAFFTECGKIAGPMALKDGTTKNRTASVFYGESAFRKALENRGFSLSVRGDTVTASALATKEEKAAAKEKVAKEAKEKTEKAIADGVASALEKANKEALAGIPITNLADCIGALIAAHGIKTVSDAVAKAAKAQRETEAKAA